MVCWIASQKTSLPTTANATDHHHHDTDDIISGLLVNIQNLLATCDNLAGDQLSKESDSYVRRDHKSIADFTRLLKLNGILDQVNSSLPHLMLQTEDILQCHLARLLPFLDCYLKMAREHLTAQSQWLKALCKLDYVLCSVMLTLARQGFCQPPDSNDGQPGEDTGEVADGVGIGEGAGTENVSKEIEDDSQVEGLQNDAGDSKENQDGSKEDTAVELTESFDGDLEDVPDTGSQGEKDSDSDGLSEMEEEQGKLDSSDPSAVDEKLWGDDKSKAEHADDKFDQDRSKQTDGESEMVAKENAATNKSPEKDQPDQKNDPDETSPEPIDAAENDDQLPDAGRPSIDEILPESDILDLPDDINFDEEKGDQQDSDTEMIDDDHLDAVSDAGEYTGEPEIQDGTENVQGDEQPVEGDAEQPETDEVTMGQPDVSTGRNTSRDDDPSHRSSGEDAVEQIDGHQGAGQSAESNNQPSPEKQ